ncbi:tyrosine-type recombinase/integrase [Cupriavidus basilensis]
MLISKLLEEYLRNKILAPDTVKSYKEKTTHLIREVGDIDVKELSVDNLIDYRNKVIKSTSASTYNTLHRHLSAIFHYGVETGVVASSPFRVVRKAPVHHELPKVIQREKLSLLFQLLDNPEHPWPPCMRPIWFWRAFIKTLYFTGMRRRQILNLEWRDIDVEQRTIHLRSETSKTRRSYDIPVPQSLLSELGTYRKIYCKRLGGTKPTWKVFNVGPFRTRAKRTDPQEAMGEWNLRDVFAELRNTHGIVASCHRFRHTTGTKLMRVTKNPKLVQLQLGHTSLNTTMKYVHPDIDEMRDLVSHL